MGVRAGVEGEGVAVGNRLGGGACGWVNGETVGESAGGVGRAGWVSADSVGEDVRDAGGWNVGDGVNTDVAWDGAGAGPGGAGLRMEVGPSVIMVAWQPANTRLATIMQAKNKETRMDYRQTAGWRGRCGFRCLVPQATRSLTK